MTFGAAEGIRVVSARDVEPAEVPGHSFRVLADGATTGGAYSLTDAVSPVGAAVPPHVHDDSVECFFVVGGEYRLTVSGQTRVAGPGDFQLVPRGAPHEFEVVGQEPGRAFVLFTPAGFEQVFRQMPEVFGTEGEPGPLWQQLNARYGTRLLDNRTLSGPSGLLVPDDGATRTGQLTTLATPAETRTGLTISVRSDPVPGTVWRLGRGTTAVWTVSGRYRFETADCSFTVGEGEFVSLADAPPARAIALTPGSQALFLRLREQE